MATDSDYEVLEKIGQGSFGVIRKVRRKADGEILCRKEISYTRMSDREKEQLHAELQILQSLRHTNIVQYYHRQHLKSSHDLHLYMEYCGNGDLGGYIRKLKERNKYADEEFIWAIFAQLVGALYRCHYGEDPPPPGKEGDARKGKALVSKQGHRVILHRDLKPENVFLGENNSVKLGDFGLSKIIASHDFASTYVGTPFYMSPEICAAERYSHYSDIWSLGCIIYELATRQVPFEARSHMELVLKIKQGRVKPLPPQYSADLSEAISWCLKTDARQRPDCAQLLTVANIKVARTRLEQASALGHLDKLQQERDSALNKLALAHKQIQEMQAEVAKLREANKKVEMEWHARAALAIDQKVQEAQQKYMSDLKTQFDAAVEQRAEEKLSLHLASLPSSRGASSSQDTSVHVRSSTPPPGRQSAARSFHQFDGVLPDTSASSLPEVLEDSVLDGELTSLSLNDNVEEPEEASPLARRTAKPPPKKAVRKPFTRAKTLANYNFGVKDSPMDVHMADPSPMPMHYKGLGLSPGRRNNGPQERLTSEPLKRNIFSVAQEKENRAPIRGRTLVELSQSPAKWNPMVHGEEMPSPFVKRR
ncbi:G2-specific kinase nim-1 [Lecanosticta acicola]|uniref:non-specific serine/threonine protein kinase n=1 Tax=Lecanosticta acicola TaxID=111012 RepID=A0AAI9E8M0_9PEZI|nr:G2-specific kinase nim-1 [Lecanosticta acicola]